MLRSACAPGAHYLCHRCCSMCTLHTPRAFTRPVCSWRALLVPPVVQLVQSPHASSPYSTRVVLTRTTCVTDVAACALFTLRAFTRPVRSRRALLVPPIMQLVQSPHASSLYSTRVLLARSTCTADDAACAISERLGPLLDPSSPCRHELSRRCYSLCSLRTPRAFTRPGFPGGHELSHRCYSLCSDDSTHDVPSLTFL